MPNCLVARTSGPLRLQLAATETPPDATVLVILSIAVALVCCCRAFLSGD